MSSADRQSGLYATHQCRLLNQLGFGKVTLVSGDHSIVDYSWSKLSKRSLVKKIENKKQYYKRKYYKKKNREDKDNIKCIEHLLDFLKDESCDNRLIIDYNWKKYIKKHLNNGRPVGASFDFTSLHRFEGDPEDHAVVVRGYDDDNIFVVDSHWRSYRGKWAKYRNGYYKISWDDFLVNSTGELILIG